VQQGGRRFCSGAPREPRGRGRAAALPGPRPRFGEAPPPRAGPGGPRRGPFAVSFRLTLECGLLLVWHALFLSFLFFSFAPFFETVIAARMDALACALHAVRHLVDAAAAELALPRWSDALAAYAPMEAVGDGRLLTRRLREPCHPFQPLPPAAATVRLWLACPWSEDAFFAADLDASSEADWSADDDDDNRPEARPTWLRWALRGVHAGEGRNGLVHPSFLGDWRFCPGLAGAAAAAPPTLHRTGLWLAVRGLGASADDDDDDDDEEEDATQESPEPQPDKDKDKDKEEEEEKEDYVLVFIAKCLAQVSL